MLRKLELKNVGPADQITLDPVATRFNLFTGDNGLGKSFLLEAAWWALTRTWHETPAVPTSADASIGYSFDGDKKIVTTTSNWIGRPAVETRSRTAAESGSGSVCQG